MRLVAAAQADPTPDNQSVMIVQSNEAARLGRENEEMLVDYNRIRFLLQVLTEYRRQCSTMIIDLGNEIASQIRRRDYAKTSQSAIRSAMGIMGKFGIEKQMDEEASQRIEDEFANTMGEVDHFLNMTKEIMATSSLQSSADTAEALKNLAEWKNKSGGVMFGTAASGLVSKNTIIATAQAQIAAAPAAFTISKADYQVVPVGRGSDDYMSMISNKK